LYNLETSSVTLKVSAPALIEREAKNGDPIVPPYAIDKVTIQGRSFSPLGGIPNRRTIVYADTSDGFDVYVADRYGFRNDDQLWDRAVAVVAVGDSFTFGSSAASNESFVAVLSKSIGPVINLGFGGNGPLSALATLVEYGAALNPRLVLWFYYPNDLEQDLSFEYRNDILVKYLNSGFQQELAQNMAAIGPEMERHFWANYEAWKARQSREEEIAYDLVAWFETGVGHNPLNAISGLTLRRTRKVLGLIEGGGDWPEPPRSLFHDVLQEAKQLAASVESRIVFVYLPSWSEIIMGDETKARYRDAALDVAKNLQLPVINLRPAFLQPSDPRSLGQIANLGIMDA